MSARISDRPGWLRAAALAVLAAGAVACLQAGTAAQRAWRQFPLPLARPLPPGLTEGALLAALSDQARVGADLAYVDCLQYVGNLRNANDNHYQKTLALYREVLWLDPVFRDAVREGISLLGWVAERPAEAETLARAAMAVDPKEERYGAYLAALGYKKKLDPLGVIEALLPEVRRPDAPPMLVRMVGNLYLRQKMWPQAFRYWMWVAGSTQDLATLQAAQRSLKQAKQGLDQARLSIPR